MAIEATSGLVRINYQSGDGGTAVLFALIFFVVKLGQPTGGNLFATGELASPEALFENQNGSRTRPTPSSAGIAARPGGRRCRQKKGVLLGRLILVPKHRSSRASRLVADLTPTFSPQCQCSPGT